MINSLVSYFQKDGRPTIRGLEHFKDIEARLAGAEAKIAAIAAITKPSGGATVDAQARTAIDAIIDAAD
ncbi:MAG: hypothetical protein ACPGSI_13915 [Pikeienuella sp.]